MCGAINFVNKGIIFLGSPFVAQFVKRNFEAIAMVFGENVHFSSGPIGFICQSFIKRYSTNKSWPNEERKKTTKNVKLPLINANIITETFPMK